MLCSSEKSSKKKLFPHISTKDFKTSTNLQKGCLLFRISSPICISETSEKLSFLLPWIGICSHRCQKPTNFLSFVCGFFCLGQRFANVRCCSLRKVHTVIIREKNYFILECCWIVSLILKRSQRFTFFFWAGTALQSRNAGPLLLCCHVKKKEKKVFSILTTSCLFTLQL